MSHVIYCSKEAKEQFDRAILQYINNLPEFLKIENKEKMKEIKCIENNGYNITVGNIYMVLQETPDFYYMINDKGTTVKYAKAMFEDTEVEVEPEPVKQRTEQDMIDSLNVTSSRVIFRNIEDNEVSFNYYFDEEVSDISCGIGQLYALNSVLETINSCMPNDDDYIELRKAIMRGVIKERIINRSNGDERAMRILSTTTNQDSDMLSVLDEMADFTSEEKHNPNSGNTIKMWLFYTE